MTPGVERSALGEKSGLKPGVPMPRVRLPENFVDRPDALSSVKEKLLLESEQTLVVSAIAGLGGLGKSVLATAIVLDAEVQRWFEDGILWVTLGQNPDLQSCLGDWIRELDKSRDSFSATTLESASGYLHNLLAERRMLLVVDDVWNAAHAEWFRVGGVGCRVLVTTREARLEGAQVYPLALMSEGEAIDLVRRKLGRLWKAADEGEVRSFAKVLGYLPLALDLAANQVRDGLSWGELRSEFEDERRSVALEILDSSEAWERLSEEEQRKYSLRACFNLSLKRLNPEQLQRFAWLGVLPEDVDLNGTIAEVLWDVRSIQAKKGLIDLRSRSFLTDGVQTVEGVAVYRVHDLMHDTARGLIEKGELGIENWEMAHGAFLERYRGRSGDGSWYGLPNDGYIHRHLTWHLEMAGRFDAVHELMASGEDQNDWFEACDKIGQPGIFVEDVRRGWRLAEELYDRDRGRAIVLQCRYALITGTLNSLVGNLTADLIVVAVETKKWTVEQAWSYIEQMDNDHQIYNAINDLSPYLPHYLIPQILDKANSLHSCKMRFQITLSITHKNIPQYFYNVINEIRRIKDKNDLASSLSILAKIDNNYLNEAIEAINKIQDDKDRALYFCDIVSLDGSSIEKILNITRLMKNKTDSARVLTMLAYIDDRYLPNALEACYLINNQRRRIQSLSLLVSLKKDLFEELLYLINCQNNKSWKDNQLRNLIEGSLNCISLCRLVEVAEEITRVHSRIDIYIEIAKKDRMYCKEAFLVINDSNDELHNSARYLSQLARIDECYFSYAMESSRNILDSYEYTKSIFKLGSHDPCFWNCAINSLKLITNISHRFYVLCDLFDLELVDFEVLCSLVQNYDGEHKARYLVELAKYNPKFIDISVEYIRDLDSVEDRAMYMTSISIIDNFYLSEAEELIRLIQDDEIRITEFCHLAKIDKKYVDEILTLVEKVEDEYQLLCVFTSLSEVESHFCGKAIECISKKALLIPPSIHPIKRLSRVENINHEMLLRCLENEDLQSSNSEPHRARLLCGLLEDIPSRYLSKIAQAMTQISRPSQRARVVGQYLTRLPLARLPYTDWKTYLHLLAHLKRASLMGDLATLYPAILHLGGEDAGRGMVGEMGRVCKQWK